MKRLFIQLSLDVNLNFKKCTHVTGFVVQGHICSQSCGWFTTVKGLSSWSWGHQI